MLIVLEIIIFTRARSTTLVNKGCSLLLSYSSTILVNSNILFDLLIPTSITTIIGTTTPTNTKERVVTKTKQKSVRR